MTASTTPATLFSLFGSYFKEAGAFDLSATCDRPTEPPLRYRGRPDERERLSALDDGTRRPSPSLGPGLLARAPLDRRRPSCVRARAEVFALAVVRARPFQEFVDFTSTAAEVCAPRRARVHRACCARPCARAAHRASMRFAGVACRCGPHLLLVPVCSAAATMARRTSRPAEAPALVAPALDGTDVLALVGTLVVGAVLVLTVRASLAACCWVCPPVAVCTRRRAPHAPSRAAA